MKKTIKQKLKELDALITEVQPKTMDEFIELVHSHNGIGAYGTHFSIVKYKGYTQGVRAYITARKNSYRLPFKESFCYSVFNGLEKYEKAGTLIEYSQD